MHVNTTSAFNTSYIIAVTCIKLHRQLQTSSSDIAEGPRDALRQLKSCQLLHNCTKITFDYKHCPFMWYKNMPVGSLD